MKKTRGIQTVTDVTVFPVIPVKGAKVGTTVICICSFFVPVRFFHTYCGTIIDVAGLQRPILWLLVLD